MSLPIEAIAIGASSGALEAVSLILKRLPQDFPIPILLTVHLPADRPSALVDVLATSSRHRICEAEDKQPVEPQTTYVAPPDYHLLVESDRRISLSSEEPVHYSRPSIDVMLETAADAYGPHLVGVILTGANSDGAAGLRRVWEAGGVPLVQSPEEASAAAMPQAALEACPEARVMTLEQIAEFLQQLRNDR